MAGLAFSADDFPTPIRYWLLVGEDETLKNIKPTDVR
jgi:hypothetical protein